METPLPQQRQERPACLVMGQQLKLASLMQNGGLIVIGETVVTLHEEAPDTQCWMTIGCGIPCLAAGEERLTVSVSGLDDGESLYEFHLSSRDKYKELDKHFHVLTTENPQRSGEEKTYGLNFAHEIVAERFIAAVTQLAPGERSNKPPHFGEKATRLLPEESTDLPSLQGHNKHSSLHVEEAGALTASGRITSWLEESGGVDDQAVRLQQKNEAGAAMGECHQVEFVEEVDDGKRKMSASKRTKATEQLRERVDISHPTYCKHVAHVGMDTPVHTLAQVIKTGEDPTTVSREMTASHSSTKSDKEERCFPPPPPPVTNFEKLLQEMQAQNVSTKRNLEATHAADEGDGEGTDSVSMISEISCGESFHVAVAQLIKKKLHDEALYSKLVSFTASGREERCEKLSKRAASVIIHDHGIVCL